MIRNLRALGLALLAIGAMGAVAAPGVQAEFSAQLTAGESAGVTIEGQQIGKLVFTRGAVPVTCEEASFHADVPIGATTITATPTYGECHATGPFGETWPTTITMNECDYLLQLTADKVGEQHTYTAVLDLVCPKEKQVVLHVYTTHTKHTNNETLCTINVPEQKGLTSIDLTNKAADAQTLSDWIEAHISISGITSNREGSALCGSVHHTTGALHGTAELKAILAPPSIAIATD